MIITNHNIIKLSETRNKEKVLKAARERDREREKEGQREKRHFVQGNKE